MLRYDKGKYHSGEFEDGETPPYAILSHTWSLANDDEVLYQDVLGGLESTKKDLSKLEFCKERAAAAGLDYFWIDTCCIDKAISAELDYSIRSMYRWYEKPSMCFVYLPDLPTKKRKSPGLAETTWEELLKSQRWFTRG